MQSILEKPAAEQAGSAATVERPPLSLSFWPEGAAFSLYAALVALAIPYHEPFVDEAQAWQLARSLSLHDLFVKYLGYEGAPGLWHFLLWILSRARVSYGGLHWICGAVAVAATSLLIFRSPLPRYLRLTLPFTYFLLFHYAVVARNYVLVPLLLYAIALCWKKKPITVAVLLGLLANSTLHAAVISGGLAILYGYAQIRDKNARRPWPARLLPAAIILLLFYAFAIWTAFPPRDLSIIRAVGGPHSFFVYASASLVEATCQPWLLGIPFWIAIAFCFGARHKLLYLLPVLFFAIFSGVVSANFWHSGLLVPLLVCLLWITWPDPGTSSSRYELAGRGAVLVLAVTQILWAAYAITYDHSHAYSPDQAAAKFLHPFVHDGTTIGITYFSDPEKHAFANDPQDTAYISVGILPYFNHNIFLNLPNSFWWWTANNPTEQRFVETLRSRPRIVLVEVVRRSPGPIGLNNSKAELLTEHGYRLTNTFCGIMPQKLQPQIMTCHLVYQLSE